MINSKVEYRESTDEHFGHRLEVLLTKAGVPKRGRIAWLQREFGVSKRTPSLWLEGVIPRYAKLTEIAESLNALLNLQESPKTTEHWLMTGKSPESFDVGEPSEKTEYPDLDHYTKSLILKELLQCSQSLGILLHNIDRSEVNRMINTLNTLIMKRGEDFLASDEFRVILLGQLEQARQLYLQDT